MKNQLVSVIMPCFNDGAYIEESVACVHGQSYRDIELIIIDDGSDDKETLEILDKLQAENKCRLIHTNRARPAGARNAGIEAAKGEYILPLDSDDLIEPGYIEKAVRIMEDEPDVGIVYCYADLFGKRSGPWELPPYSINTMVRENVIFVTALFRREDWQRVGGFNINMNTGLEDYDFWIGILGLGRKVRQIPEILFHYRIKNISRTSSLLCDVESAKKMYENIYNNHPDFFNRYKEIYIKELRDAYYEELFLNQRMSSPIGYIRMKAEKAREVFKQQGLSALIRKCVNAFRS